MPFEASPSLSFLLKFTSFFNSPRSASGGIIYFPLLKTHVDFRWVKNGSTISVSMTQTVNALLAILHTFLATSSHTVRARYRLRCPAVDRCFTIDLLNYISSTVAPVLSLDVNPFLEGVSHHSIKKRYPSRFLIVTRNSWKAEGSSWPGFDFGV